MADLIPASEELLDAGLTRALGAPDATTMAAIADICNDAVERVLGSAIVDILLADPDRLHLTAPWVWDLARGLHFQSFEGSREPATTSLLTLLAGPQLTGFNLAELARQIDITAVLALGQVVAQVAGPDATARDPRINEEAAPWLTGLKLGVRIHLVQEMLRLLPPKGRTQVQ